MYHQYLNLNYIHYWYQIFVLLLVTSYVIGEFILPKYALFSLINLIGIIGLILSLTLFFSSLNLFNSYKENPRPQADTNKIIKTGIFAYCRNPMYLAFISFHLSMFLTFENVAYFLSAIGLFVWINTYVIPEEELTEYQKIMRDADLFQLFQPNWVHQCLLGLS